MGKSSTARMSKIALIFITGCAAVFSWIGYYFFSLPYGTDASALAFACLYITLIPLGLLAELLHGPYDSWDRRSKIIAILVKYTFLCVLGSVFIMRDPDSAWVKYGWWAFFLVILIAMDIFHWKSASSGSGSEPQRRQ